MSVPKANEANIFPATPLPFHHFPSTPFPFLLLYSFSLKVEPLKSS